MQRLVICNTPVLVDDRFIGMPVEMKAS